MVQKARMIGESRGPECRYHCCRYLRDEKKYIKGLKKRDRQSWKKDVQKEV